MFERTNLWVFLYCILIATKFKHPGWHAWKAYGMHRFTHAPWAFRRMPWFAYDVHWRPASNGPTPGNSPLCCWVGGGNPGVALDLWSWVRVRDDEEGFKESHWRTPIAPSRLFNALSSTNWLRFDNPLFNGVTKCLTSCFWNRTPHGPWF